VKTDFAGLGGDSRYFRATGDARYFYEVFEDVVGIARVQGGHIQALGGEDLRIVDHFFLGPSLVRGFASSGIGPRDVSTTDTRANAIGGTTYFGGSLEVQFPIFGLPREIGLKGAVFADAGTLFGRLRPDDLHHELGAAANLYRGSRQQGHPLLCRRKLALEFAAGSDPLRLCVCLDEG
jgi:outer membrane protein assembly factor BamA